MAEWSAGGGAGQLRRRTSAALGLSRGRSESEFVTERSRGRSRESAQAVEWWCAARLSYNPRIPRGYRVYRRVTLARVSSTLRSPHEKRAIAIRFARAVTSHVRVARVQRVRARVSVLRAVFTAVISPIHTSVASSTWITARLDDDVGRSAER